MDIMERGCPRGSVVKKLPANIDLGSVPGSGRSPGGGNGNPLQYSCHENPMDREARWVTDHGITESNMTEHARMLWRSSWLGADSRSRPPKLSSSTTSAAMDKSLSISCFSCLICMVGIIISIYRVVCVWFLISVIH